MESLSQLPKLHSLHLIQTSVTGTGLRRLGNASRPLSLSLTADSLSVDDLRQLKHVSGLRSLSLTSLAHEGQLLFLDDLEQISMLQLRGVRLTRAGIDMLNRRTKLHVSLNLVDAQDEELSELAQLQVMRSLTVQNSASMTDAGWKHLEGAGIQLLTVVQSNLTDNGMASIAKCDKLEHLMIYGAPITDAAIEHLRAFPRLRYLTLNKTQVSEEGLKLLKKARPTLQIR